MLATGVSAERFTTYDVGVAEGVPSTRDTLYTDHKVRIVADKKTKSFYAATQEQLRMSPNKLYDPKYYPERENRLTEHLCVSNRCKEVVGSLIQQGFVYKSNENIDPANRITSEKTPPRTVEQHIEQIHQETARFNECQEEKRENFLLRQKKRVANAKKDFAKSDKAHTLYAAAQKSPSAKDEKEIAGAEMASEETGTLRSLLVSRLRKSSS